MIAALRTVVLDLRFALRQARRTPLFTAIVTLTIALGLGAATAIFSVVDAVMLRPLPFAHGEQLVSLWASNPDKSILRFGVSYADFNDWAARTHSFTGMALYNGGTTTLIGPDGPENVAGLNVTRNFFDVLGVQPAMGRGFGADDEHGEASNALLISDGYWRRRFGGDRAIVGKQFSVNGRMRTVIGVLPPEMQILGPGFLGAPLDIVTVVEPSIYPKIELHAQHLFGSIARLRPGVTLAQASADLYSTEVRLAKEHADIAGWTASVFTVADDLSQGTREPQIILLAAAGLLLLIACINVANLLLVRGATRAREVASRMAVGASRARIVSQFVTESMVLALFGGTAGVAIAAVALRAVRGMLPFGVIVRAGDIRLDAGVVLFALALSGLCALGFGLLPALRSTSLSLGESLRAGGRSNTGDARSHRVRRVLVIAEISVALVLVVCAGLVSQSLRRVLRVDPGFRAEHTITAQITLGKNYPDSAAIPFYRSLLTNLEGRAGIEAAGATDTPPLAGGGIFTSIRLMGAPPRPPDQPLMSTIRLVTPGFFRAMGMRVLGGREIQWNEPVPEIVLSQAAAKSFWPSKNAVGEQIAFHSDTNGLPVVGEVNDTRQTSLAVVAGPVVYVSMRRYMRVFHTMTVVVRGKSEPAGIVASLRDAVREIDPALPVFNVQSLQEIVDQSTAQTRLNTMLLDAFGAAALLLAALGMYGVVSYTVTQRRQEIGVRMALGAHTGDVLGLVLREGAALAFIGVSCGVVIAMFATRFIQSWLFEVGRGDPVTFAAVSLALVGIALAASYIPARRAATIDPLLAMRAD